MNIKFVLTGAECTGKSTLAKKLSEYYNVDYAKEFLREYYDLKNGHLTIADATAIAKGQIENENKVQHQIPFICDTDIISSVVYSKYYFGSCPEWITDKSFSIKNTIYLVCATDIEWQFDSQRDSSIVRNKLHRNFISEIKKRNLPLYHIDGNITKRMQKLITTIDNLIYK